GSRVAGRTPAPRRAVARARGLAPAAGAAPARDLPPRASAGGVRLGPGPLRRSQLLHEAREPHHAEIVEAGADELHATGQAIVRMRPVDRRSGLLAHRSEEHTSELQSRENLVCRL